MTARRNPARSRTANGQHHRSLQSTEHTGGVATIIDAIEKQNDLLYEAARNASERSHRLTQAAVDDMQSAQRDLIALAQRWVESPFDLLSLYTGVVEAAVSARGRAAQSFARWRYELSQARTEATDAVRRSVRLGLQANQAGADAARGVLVRRNGAS